MSGNDVIVMTSKTQDNRPFCKCKKLLTFFFFFAVWGVCTCEMVDCTFGLSEFDVGVRDVGKMEESENSWVLEMDKLVVFV